MRHSLSTVALALACAVPLGTAHAQLTHPLDSAALAAFRWRAVGPAIMGGRVSDIQADPRDARVYYVATAAGGIWKTVNNGTTFFPLFDHEKVVSMGMLAIAPSNPDVIYAGTGEPNTRNSISPGGGVYKSIDAGKTWKLVGLEKTQQIGRIVVDPRDANVVYVAALGHAWEANPDRGLYKTTDGGATWQRVKFVSDRAGFVDVALDPRNPEVVWATSWERVRGPYYLKSGGPGSGLWKSTDAGRTWTQVRGNGYPNTTFGRIGLAVSPSNPNVVYALTEADTTQAPKGTPSRVDPNDPDAQVIGLGGQVPRSRTNSGLYRTTDGGRTWTLMYRNEDDARPFYYSQVRVDPQNPDRVYWMSSVFRFSDDGGKTVRRGALSIHTDWHAMWIDPKDPNHFIIGDDGGIAVTWDRGGTYDFLNTFPIGQFYAVSYDMQKPYRVCGGLQDNGSWCGPSRTRSRQGATNAEWFNVGGGDGFYTAQDPNDANVIYSESQGGNASRLDIATNARTVINRGGGRNRRSAFEDSLIVARGDTTRPETPQVRQAVEAVKERAKQDSLNRVRFNWETPLLLSPHNPQIVYMGGSRVLMSTDRGDHFHPISPDLSTKDSARIKVSLEHTGGVTPDNTGAETFGTVTTLAESPVRPGILWAGTDDGNVWVTRNGGGSWESVTTHFPGVPKGTWVSRVEPSGHDTATVYVAFDGHQTNDFTPYLFVSRDFGRTFTRITNGIPNDGAPNFVHVVREDPHDRNLLFAGTDVAAYVSTDAGASWQRFMTGLPTVPVHDLKIHPRDHELIAATHGRSIWIVDIAPLEQMSDSAMRAQVVAFAPAPAYEYTLAYTQQWNGNKLFQADNPPFGATLSYWVSGGAEGGAPTRAASSVAPAGGPNAQADTAPAPAAGPARGGRRGGRMAGDSARIVITDVKGDTVRTLSAPAGAGVHFATWDLRRSAPALSPTGVRDSIRSARRLREREDSTLAALRTDTTGTGRAVAGLVSGSDSVRRAIAQRYASAPDSVHERLVAGVRALPDSVRRSIQTALGPTFRMDRGRQGSPAGPNLRPAEEPVGGLPGGANADNPFRARRQGALVAEGDYLATITVHGQTAKQVIHVERTGPVSEGEFGDDDADQDDDAPRIAVPQAPLDP